jgi:hypothetical protein
LLAPIASQVAYSELQSRSCPEDLSASSMAWLSADAPASLFVGEWNVRRDSQSLSDNECVEKRLHADLWSLSKRSTENCFYNSKDQVIERLYFHPYCFLKDRPERSSFTRTGAGNASYSARPGYAGDLTNVIRRNYHHGRIVISDC